MIFRAARHTNCLSTISAFYVNVLNLEILSSFKNHKGYDGIFLGKQNVNWHIEFTTSKDTAHHSFDEDDLFVFYPNTKEEYELILKNIHHYKIPLLTPRNPYWLENGFLINDPDGYYIIISNSKIKTP